MPKIGVAAVNGPAAGAGFTLAAACDLRIAAASARFSTSFAKVGLSGDMGGSHTLPRLIGPTLARDLSLTRRSVDAEEALRIGLVSEDRKSGVWGKSVSVSVDVGGRRIIK